MPKDLRKRQQVLAANVFGFGRLCRKQLPHFLIERQTLDHAETKSALEFARYVRLNFVCRGYFFYVAGMIPEYKDPARTDAKIKAQYGLHISKWERARQRRRGIASVQYLRFGREFIILATQGKHRFFQAESQGIRDIRRTPLQVRGLRIHYGRKRSL